MLTFIGHYPCWFYCKCFSLILAWQFFYEKTYKIALKPKCPHTILRVAQSKSYYFVNFAIFSRAPQNWFVRVCTKIDVALFHERFKFDLTSIPSKILIILRASQNGFTWLTLISMMECQFTYSLDHFQSARKFRYSILL